jgi:ABC-type Fe3+/spermidine/putrescine transport system ATPase subunit
VAELRLTGIGKALGRLSIVRDISLVVPDGEFLTLLGPSGCGKTTTLRLVAGFTAPTTGEIVLDGRLLSSAAAGVAVAPEDRGMGMVFQSYAVWPHMTAFANVAYPLRRAGLSRAEVEARTRRALGLVQMGGLGDRYPQQLSGGQQQRVALARALVNRPALLLLDEPLSNLDAALRGEMREELRDLRDRLGITVLYVTHDQAEAMGLSSRIAVMRAGQVAQVGTPADLYERPRDPFIAALVGQANFLPGAVAGRREGRTDIRVLDGTDAHTVTVPEPCSGERVTLCVRPEDLTFDEAGPLRAAVVRATYLGNRVEYVLRVGTLTLRAEDRGRAPLAAGSAVGLRVKKAVVYAAGPGAPAGTVIPPAR